MRNIWKLMALAAVMAALIVPGTAIAGKPRIMKGCKACHQPAKDVVRGKMVGHSEKFGTVQVNVGPLVWIVNYDNKTAFKGVKDIASIPKNKEIAVTFKGTDNEPLATQVSMKQPYKLPEGREIGLEELKGVMAGDKPFTLVDSRPPGAFIAGHIPGAKLMPYPKFKAMYEKVLPADKDQLVVFYCGGKA